ncbi:GNAT family acetyltransferase [Ktedonobacter sp. SOSP1-85]|uniref:GNAT family N-acetyltransferase n=1 Tax=Ktedonobacter sp. SOSP1-85 TaxID=2778367 RepID=UPI001916814D|nr:GNAT family N-acetyltransferase [Ktedonobacter sp. SOSP1-85]GHO74210.1 GNAT family acetyltransferase [Ktedonobacter sp. SOSP1-85]
MLRLIEPSYEYKQQFIEAIREFQLEGRHMEKDVQRLTADFTSFLAQLQAQQQRRSPYAVPSTDFWLVEHEEFIGRLSLRHELNDFLLKIGGHIGYEIRPSRRRQGYGKKMLALGLAEAHKIGLSRALVTCDENNIGSKKVIEANGGQFENATLVEGSPIRKLRYWIDLTDRRC